MGYCLELALRPGVKHSALETQLNLERVLPMAAKLTPMPLLFRADSGLCSHAIMQDISAQAQALAREIAIIIKWNPRSTPVESIAAERLADASTMWCHEREGKRMCLWSQELKLEGVGTQANPARRVLRLTQRTIVDLGFCHKHGNPLLLPAYELEGWTTTLPHKFTMHEVIALYKDHATHEQFHSEFKSDMDLERLPSGKFDTNFLVCALAAVAMNVLRLIGQNALIGDDAPLRHAAKRRRMKTVMQEIMFKAGRMIKHAGRWTLAGVSDVRCAEAPDRVHCLGRADQTDPYHIGADLKPPRTWQARGPPLWDDSDAQTDDGAQIAAHWNLAAQPAPDDEVDQRVNW
ncbi:MAG: hypothetical protein EBR83_04570 [Verrucomicrobia bacterium]|nr:hypothetical protein [Verrucomicrobiota bacterium]